MKRISALLLSLSALLAAGSARAEEGRFDTQAFRPLPGPRDLVMVQKSEVIGHLSPVLGIYYDVGLDPLAIFVNDTGQTVEAVAARLQFTGLVGLGLFGWLDLGLAVPFIAWQTGDNLRTFGSEGPVETPTFGDLRISSKVALPWLNRKEEVKEGFGMALAGNLNLPTGNQDAFSGEGALSGGAMIIADYRFHFGLLLATNFGVWLRPDHQFAGVRVGDMAQFGVAAEQYVVQRWGLSILGEVYGYPSLTTFPDSPAQVPAEFLLGIRWQTKHGITITFGGSFGAACGFGAPSIRFFNGITWTPKSSREQDEINRLQQKDEEDPDKDGMTEAADKCPDLPGTPENLGCPDQDRDGDGILDRDDECPDLDAGPRGQRGCPTAYIKGDEIVILDQIHFATDRDIILEESLPILEEIARVLVEHPEILLVRIEGHTDVRASDAYNMSLSQRRVNSVKAELEKRGVDPSRLEAKGYGHSAPIYDDGGCVGRDEDMSPDCRFMTSKNRRVVFRILRTGAPQARAISGAPAGQPGVLPTNDTVLPKGGTTLPTQGTLPKGTGVLEKKKDGVLPNQSVLPSGGDGGTGGAVLKGQGLLPNKSGGGVLPRAGTPAPAPSPQSPPPPPPSPHQ